MRSALIRLDHMYAIGKPQNTWLLIIAKEYINLIFYVLINQILSASHWRQKRIWPLRIAKRCLLFMVFLIQKLSGLLPLRLWSILHLCWSGRYQKRWQERPPLEDIKKFFLSLRFALHRFAFLAFAFFNLFFLLALFNHFWFSFGTFNTFHWGSDFNDFFLDKWCNHN